MIIILPLNGAPAERFENYDELFDCITRSEDVEFGEKHSDIANVDWSFTIYPPKQVSILQVNSNNPPEAMMEAFEEHLPLIKICAGDCKRPLYIVFTPNVDVDYLKRKWCIDYCTFHHLLVREVG